jgi:hypothetical protein
MAGGISLDHYATQSEAWVHAWEDLRDRHPDLNLPDFGSFDPMDAGQWQIRAEQAGKGGKHGMMLVIDRVGAEGKVETQPMYALIYGSYPLEPVNPRI